MRDLSARLVSNEYGGRTGHGNVCENREGLTAAVDESRRLRVRRPRRACGRTKEARLTAQEIGQGSRGRWANARSARHRGRRTRGLSRWKKDVGIGIRWAGISAGLRSCSPRATIGVRRVVLLLSIPYRRTSTCWSVVSKRESIMLEVGRSGPCLTGRLSIVWSLCAVVSAIFPRCRVDLVFAFEFRH